MAENDPRIETNREVVEMEEKRGRVVGTSHPMQTRSKSGIFKPKVHTYFVEKQKKKIINLECEPQTVTEALQFHGWKNAMSQEMRALITNNTWSPVPFSKDYNLVGNKWVFKTMYNQDETIQRFKARLVAQGFSPTS